MNNLQHYIACTGRGLQMQTSLTDCKEFGMYAGPPSSSIGVLRELIICEQIQRISVMYRLIDIHNVY